MSLKAAELVSRRSNESKGIDTKCVTTRSGQRVLRPTIVLAVSTVLWAKTMRHLKLPRQG
jgi:hypothetical protein